MGNLTKEFLDFAEKNNLIPCYSIYRNNKTGNRLFFEVSYFNNIKMAELFAEQLHNEYLFTDNVYCIFIGKEMIY